MTQEDVDKLRSRYRIGSIVVLILLFLFWKVYSTRDQTPAPQIATAEEEALAATPTPDGVGGTPVTPESPEILEMKAGEDPQMNQKIAQLRGEMRSYLSSVYTAEKAYYAEFGRYTTDLNNVGFLPNQHQMRIKMGFMSPFQPNELQQGEDPRSMDTDAFVGEQETDYDGKIKTYAYEKSAEELSLRELEQYCEMGCTATGEQFEILAAAMLPNGKMDVWRINHRKELVHMTKDPGEEQTPILPTFPDPEELPDFED